MTAISQSGPVRNYCQLLDMSDYLVTTDLFPEDVLVAYSLWNLERDVSDQQRSFFDSQRGGGQGDYRQGMRNKIANVIDCLRQFSASKRAIITIPNNANPNHQSDDDAKCMRELHLYFEHGKLCATVMFRAQAALIFPKNIHFIGMLMDEIAEGLGAQVGTLFYLTTVLVSDRQ